MATSVEYDAGCILNYWQTSDYEFLGKRKDGIKTVRPLTGPCGTVPPTTICGRRSELVQSAAPSLWLYQAVDSSAGTAVLGVFGTDTAYPKFSLFRADNKREGMIVESIAYGNYSEVKEVMLFSSELSYLLIINLICLIYCVKILFNNIRY